MRSGTALVAALLGSSAFVADFVDGPAGRVMVVLTSSGFAWGLAGFLVARATPYGRAGAAVGRATGLLVTATVVYYALILVGTRRWMAGGVVTEGLLDVGLMTALWVAGSIVGGAVLGVLGWLVRRAGEPGREQPGLMARNGPVIAAGALGLACGLLAGQGLARAAVGPQGLRGELFAAVGVGELLMIGLPLGVLVRLATAHRLWRAWPVLLGAAAGAAGAGAVGWVLVEQVARYAIHGQPVGL